MERTIGGQRSALAALLTGMLAAMAGCRAGVEAPSAAAPLRLGTVPTGKVRSSLVVGPSRLQPEVDPHAFAPWMSEGGRHMLLVGGLRISQSDDGAVARSDERFPAGAVRSLPLPARLGGGFLFYQSDSGGTRLWRAPTWVAPLVKLASVRSRAEEVVVGFDRLYLRVRSSHRLLAIDAESGGIRPLGQLPPASAYGAMVFADGWRGVIDTDLRGPMATFDAGATWLPLGIDQQVLHSALHDGDPVLFVAGGYYRLDLQGHLQRVSGDAPGAAAGSSATVEPARGTHPLGPHPLRIAVEHGIPFGPARSAAPAVRSDGDGDDDRPAPAKSKEAQADDEDDEDDAQEVLEDRDDDETTDEPKDPPRTEEAVVAYRGSLVRVRLPDGEALAVASRAYPDADATCTGTALGDGYGFVCGQMHGKTTVYAFKPPLALREVARFDRPRFVQSSGNGLLVVRGPCGYDAPGDNQGALARVYCVLGADGAAREIGVRGDLGAERVVALADGRVAVLVPPRLGAKGRLTLVGNGEAKSVELALPKGEHGARFAGHALWLEGFQQIDDDTLGGWMEASGAAMGVRVALDGKVTLGTHRQDNGQLLAAGPNALVVTESEGAFESTDFGQTWRSLTVPELPESPGDARSRGCSAVGCALRGWVRVGWGSPRVDGDLAIAEVPAVASVRSAPYRSARLSCDLVAEPTVEPDAEDRRSYRYRYTSWNAFMGVPPPALDKNEEGVDKGSDEDRVPTHVYAWGGKGADWTRVGWWVIRFNDPFDPTAQTHDSARTRPLWPDDLSAGMAIGDRRHRAYRTWSAQLDPSGRSALLASCAGAVCDLYATGDGQPILPLRAPAGGLRKPLDSGAVRVGESWYFLTELPGSLELWRSDLGAVEQVTQLVRLKAQRYGTPSAPQLVRRALGSEIGLLLTVAPDEGTGETVGDWVVLPVDGRTGELGEPVHLARADLDGELPPPCEPGHDGWLADVKPSISPSFTLAGVDGYVSGLEYRVMLDPGSRCVVAMAATASSNFRTATSASAASPAVRVAPDASRTPMAVRKRYESQIWHMQCAER